MNGSLGGSSLEGSQLYLGGWDVTSQVRNVNQSRDSTNGFDSFLESC